MGAACETDLDTSTVVGSPPPRPTAVRRSGFTAPPKRSRKHLVTPDRPDSPIQSSQVYLAIKRYYKPTQTSDKFLSVRNNYTHHTNKDGNKLLINHAI